MTCRQASASIFRLELLDLSFSEKMTPEEEQTRDGGPAGKRHRRAPAGQCHTWDEYGDVLRERPRQHVDQLRQHVEAALPRLDALLLQLLVQRFDDHGHLQGATESVRNVDVS